MNRKGFTLIELIIVITLIAIVSLLVTPNVIQMVENGNKDKMIADANNFLDDVMYKYSLEKYKDFYPTENCSCKKIDASNAIFAIDLDNDYAGNSYNKENSSIMVCLEDDTYKYYIRLVSEDENGYVNMISNKSDSYEYVAFEELNRSKVKKFKGTIVNDSDDSLISPTCVPDAPQEDTPTCTISVTPVGKSKEKKLTIISSNANVEYSFDGLNYGSNNEKNSVSSPGIYKGFVKLNNKKGECSITLTEDQFEKEGPLYLFKEGEGFIGGKVISYTDFKPSYGSQGFMKAIVDDTKYIALYHNKTTLYETGRYDSGPSIIIGNLDGTKIDFSKYKKLYFEFENKGYESSSSYTRASYGYTTLDNESNVYCDGASPIGFEKYVFDQTTNRTTKSIDISSVTGNYFIAAAQSSAHNYPLIFPGGVYIYNIWLE